MEHGPSRSELPWNHGQMHSSDCWVFWGSRRCRGRGALSTCNSTPPRAVSLGLLWHPLSFTFSLGFDSDFPFFFSLFNTQSLNSQYSQSSTVQRPLNSLWPSAETSVLINGGSWLLVPPLQIWCPPVLLAIGEESVCSSAKQTKARKLTELS